MDNIWEIQIADILLHLILVTGMFLPVGISLIVGGGFHGKTTLLNSIESGVYNKVRQLVFPSSYLFDCAMFDLDSR